MPETTKSFCIQDQTITITTEFELWCGRCGAPICDTVAPKGRYENQFTASCPSCEREREELEEEVARLEQELHTLRS